MMYPCPYGCKTQAGYVIRYSSQGALTRHTNSVHPDKKETPVSVRDFSEFRDSLKRQIDTHLSKAMEYVDMLRQMDTMLQALIHSEEERIDKIREKIINTRKVK